VYHDDYFLVAGYPCTQQKLRLEHNAIDALMYPFVAVSRMEGDYHTAGLDATLSLLLGFEKRQMWQVGSDMRSAPDQYGMSGGGAWWLEGYTAHSLCQPKLAAVCIEWHKGRERRLLATHIRVVLAGIRRLCPELEGSIANFVRPNPTL
jgi:hypothetical protein